MPSVPLFKTLTPVNEIAPTLVSEMPTPHLIAAIEDYIAHHNQFSAPFTWTAKVEDILSKVDRAE